MKLAFVLAAALASTACVGVKFYKGDSATQTIARDASNNAIEVGLPFRESKPYLLVTRSGAKEGGVESKIIYLPDMTTLYYAKPDPVLIGSSQFTLTLTDGRLASFNGEVEADLPGLLADLVSPVKGLAEADAARAGGALDRAEAAKILADIDKDGGGAKALFSNEGGIKSNSAGFSSAAACAFKVPNPLPAFNPQLNSEQAGTVLLAMANLVCAHSSASPLTKPAIEEAAGSLLKIYDPAFPETPAAVAIRLIGKNATAQALRAISSLLEGLVVDPASNDPDTAKVAKLVKETTTAISRVVTGIDPAKDPAPKDPYELFEIHTDASGKVTLKQVKPQ